LNLKTGGRSLSVSSVRIYIGNISPPAFTPSF
jgi:hypothetical protein